MKRIGTAEIMKLRVSEISKTVSAKKRGNTVFRRMAAAAALSFLLAAAPWAAPALPRTDANTDNPAGALFAAAESPVRTYTFQEVGDIAQLNSSEIIRQKASLDQAEQSKESALNNYQSQVSAFYSGESTEPSDDENSGDSTKPLTESALYSLQESYESALHSYTDAEDALEQLKPKVAYQAQTLYLEILQGELQIAIQEKETRRLADEYTLAQTKTAFGSMTQSQLAGAKTQWDNALDTLDSLKNTDETNKDSMREYLNLADSVEFALENPPRFGEYAAEFDADEVLAEALKNSLSLKQAQREVEELTEQIRRYEGLGEQDQVDSLSARGADTDLKLKEARQELVKKVESTMDEYAGLDAALEKAEANVNAAWLAYTAAKMQLDLGAGTLCETRTAEKNVLTAEKDLLQAQYNCYLGAKKVILLKEGILV